MKDTLAHEKRITELEDLLEELLETPVCPKCQRLAYPPGNHRCLEDADAHTTP